MAEKRRKRHSPAQIISRLREADAGLNAGDSLAAVLQKLQVSGESTGAVRVAAAGEGKNRPVSAPVTVEDALATEGADPVDTGSFRFERSGPRVDVALPIRYELSGTALNGVDYEQLSGRHVFAPQQTSSLVEVVMLEDDEVEPDEEVVASPMASGAYQVIASPVRLTAVSNDLRLGLTESDDPDGRSSANRLHCQVNQKTTFRSVTVEDGNGRPVTGMGAELSAVAHVRAGGAGGTVPMNVSFVEQWAGTFEVTILPPPGTPTPAEYNIKVALPQKYGRLAFTFIYIKT